MPDDGAQCSTQAAADEEKQRISLSKTMQNSEIFHFSCYKQAC
jgi:hypothetical protein